MSKHSFTFHRGQVHPSSSSLRTDSRAKSAVLFLCMSACAPLLHGNAAYLTTNEPAKLPVCFCARVCVRGSIRHWRIRCTPVTAVPLYWLYRGAGTVRFVVTVNAPSTATIHCTYGYRPLFSDPCVPPPIPTLMLVFHECVFLFLFLSGILIVPTTFKNARTNYRRSGRVGDRDHQEKEAVCPSTPRWRWRRIWQRLHIRERSGSGRPEERTRRHGQDAGGE